MKIRELYLRNFGKFSGKKIVLKDGINLFYGENESGKTTIHTFIKSMLFGLERGRGRASVNDTFSIYEPWENPNEYAGAMRFSCGEKTFCLKRRFDRYTKGAVLICEDDGEELSVEYGDLDMLLGNVSAAAYENTCCIGQEQLLPGRELGVLLEDERSNLAQTGSGDFQLSKALQELEQKRKNAEKTRKELEQQRLSHIHQLEVNQQVLERDIAGLKAQQEKQSTQQGTVQEQVRALQQQMEPVQTAYQTVCRREQELKSAVAQEQLEWEQAEREQWKREQFRREQEEAEALQQKSGKNAGFSPLLLIGLSGLRLAPLLRSALDGLQKIAPALNIICIILILAGLVSAYRKSREKKTADSGQKHRQSVNDSVQNHREQDSRANDRANLQSVERKGRKAALDQQLQRVCQQKSVLEEQLQQLKDQKKALQLQAARQEGSGDQVQSQIQEKEVELENLTEQMAELQQETLEEQHAREDRDALELAAETMSRLAARMSKTLEHTLDKEMSGILAQITGNVHEQLQVTDGQGIVLAEQMQKRTPEAYSQGTMQQAYFSYRMAAGHMLMKEEPLPFLLDETFANYDEERLRQTLRWLAKQENQIFLFTCRETEMRLLTEEDILFASIRL